MKSSFFIHFGILATLIYCFQCGPLASFGENCKNVETLLANMSTQYMNDTQVICNKHKADGHDQDIGTHPKDWDYIWKTLMEATDMMYESQVELPPKEKLIAVYADVRKECWKGSLCSEENQKVMQTCIDRVGTEGFLGTIGEEYIEKKMNDANCKLLTEFFDGEGGQKIREHTKKAIEEYDPKVVRKD